MQEINPLPWGALDRFQAHFIIRKDLADSNVIDYIAKTSLDTSGRFGSKKIVSVHWDGGGQLASILNDDSELNEMIIRQSIDQASIVVEPTDDNAVRIHSKWQNRHDLGISKEMFEIYDRIAGHLKNL